MQKAMFSSRANATLNALRAGETVTDREASSLRDELTSILADIHKKLFTTEHAEAVSQQQLTSEVVELLEKWHFADRATAPAVEWKKTERFPGWPPEETAQVGEVQLRLQYSDTSGNGRCYWSAEANFGRGDVVTAAWAFDRDRAAAAAEEAAAGGPEGFRARVIANVTELIAQHRRELAELYETLRSAAGEENDEYRRGVAAGLAE
ncbi:hypothetical protein [Azonexus hydrophilus]|uniref:Uncharacterized protein n=1 Tax=Azonexus hydrophilus TaxID=418702 RepID=A0ABZ2XD77_9RHOO